MKRECRVAYLGLCDYPEADRLQKRLVYRRIGGEIPDTLLLLQHNPVITTGRRGHGGNILAGSEVLLREGIPIYTADRGGDVTYHGPGQIVGYPVLDLNTHGRDVHRVINMYEQVIISLLESFGLEGSRLQGYPGVWAGDKKICAIGIGVRNLVAYHGFALNVNTNLNHFRYIRPCGIQGRGVTSMKGLLGREVDEMAVVDMLVEVFGRVFGLEMKKHILEEQTILLGGGPGGS